MKRIFTRSLSVMLALVLALGAASPALAATYRPGAQSGPSGSYAGSRYYENYKRVPITGEGRTDLVAMALSQLGYQEGNANGNLYLEFDRLRAIMLGEKITATIWDGDTQVGRTIEYSVYTYVQKNQNTTNVAMRELLEAIYNYGESAKNA